MIGVADAMPPTKHDLGTRGESLADLAALPASLGKAISPAVALIAPRRA